MRTHFLVMALVVLAGCDEEPPGPDGAASDAAAATDGAAAYDSGMSATDAGSPASDAEMGSDAATDAGPTVLPTATFDTTYMGWSTGTDTVTEYAMHGAEPVTPGAYPVFIYAVGTFGTYDSVSALAWIEYMAARGFVAATVDYSNGAQVGCAVMRDKAEGIYSDPDSAIAVLCGRPQADCDKGIVTAGHSQGSMMAMLAADYDPRVRATLALGTGYDPLGVPLNGEVCLSDERVLPDDALRAVDGESEATFGMNFIDQLDVLAGMSCGATATSCLRPNGSGWVLALDADVVDGIAEHCYMGVVPPSGMGSGCNLESDPNWLATTADWGRGAGADFLQSFVDP